MMTALDDLVATVQALTPGQINYTTRSKAYDVFEGFAFATVVEAAASAGAMVSYRDRTGQPKADLTFRTAPGNLYTAHPYTHALLEFDDVPALEVHLGVQVQGRSGVPHEIDVLVLPSREADNSRAFGVAPRGTRSLIAIECKYYAANLPISLGRGFLGLHTDVGAKVPILITNSASVTVEKLLSHHNRGWEHAMTPGSESVNDFRATCKSTFKHYRAKNVQI